MCDYILPLASSLESVFKDIPTGWVKTGYFKTVYNMVGDKIKLSLLHHPDSSHWNNERCGLADDLINSIPAEFGNRLRENYHSLYPVKERLNFPIMAHYLDLTSIYLYVNHLTEPVPYGGFYRDDMQRVLTTFSHVDNCVPCPSRSTSHNILHRGVCVYSCTCLSAHGDEIFQSEFFDSAEIKCGAVGVKQLALLDDKSISAWQSMVVRDLCIGSYNCLKFMLDAVSKFSTAAARDQQFRDILMGCLLELDNLRMEVFGYYCGLNVVGNLAELKFNLWAIAATLWHCFPKHLEFNAPLVWRQHGQVSDFIGEEYLRSLVFRIRQGHR